VIACLFIPDKANNEPECQSFGINDPTGCKRLRVAAASVHREIGSSGIENLIKDEHGLERIKGSQKTDLCLSA
jgi:hypothetical protein